MPQDLGARARASHNIEELRKLGIPQLEKVSLLTLDPPMPAPRISKRVGQSVGPSATALCPAPKTSRNISHPTYATQKSPRNLPNSTKNSRRVSFWAGLRVEGALNPFGINADELTRWNDKIHNGGLFEKIGVGLK